MIEGSKVTQNDEVMISSQGTESRLGRKHELMPVSEYLSSRKASLLPKNQLDQTTGL